MSPSGVMSDADAAVASARPELVVLTEAADASMMEEEAAWVFEHDGLRLGRRPWPQRPLGSSASARAQLQRVVDGLEARFPAVAGVLIGAEADVLVCFAFSASHRRQIRSTGPLGHLNKLGQLRERLLRRRDRLGISYYTIPGHAMEAMEPLVAALAGR